MNPEASVLQCDELAVGRGTVDVLRGVNLRVRGGERVVLVGKNGSGKTTLLRALGGLDAPRGGKLSWSGPLPHGAARVATLGILLQSEPASAFTVRDFVTLGLGLDGPAEPAAAERVRALLEELDLASLATQSVAALSGGEYQRARVARALVAGAPLLLLDEPTNHLDPSHRAALLASLDRLRARVAMVIATHDLELAASADRVLLLARGAVVAAGKPSEVLTAPLLEDALAVRIRRIEDPDGGAPWLRVTGTSAGGPCP